MNIFENNTTHSYTNASKALESDREFKLFVESRTNDGSCDKYAGYTDSKILELLKEEFSMFKNAAPNKKGEVESKKSKIPSFESIHTALKSQDYGTIFTTPQSDRIYVITKGTWGEKSDDKVVKGFALKTDMDKIKLYAKRTRVKHGGSAVNILDKDEVTPTMLKGAGKHLKLDKFKKSKDKKKK
tara:strand:- start:301 stop:855 length:555 start_codon:yes stop_codon:yes gene_type:complete